MVAFYVTLISYIIINHQEKKRKILENNKFFWLGIFFIVGAIFANTIHPLDVVNYSRYDYLVPICILLAIALIRMSFRLLRKKEILGENLK